MKKLRWIILPAALVAAAIFVPASPSSAGTNAFGTCPDGYEAAPAFTSAPGEDKNGNGVVCMKPSNGQTHDDPNGKPYACNAFLPAQPPPECQNAVFVLIGDDILP
jgi:hypothetical protein